MSATNGKARRRRSAAEKLKMLEEGRAPATTDATEREIARLRAALDKKDRIIAEVVEENLALKKGL